MHCLTALNTLENISQHSLEAGMRHITVTQNIMPVTLSFFMSCYANSCYIYIYILSLAKLISLYGGHERTMGTMMMLQYAGGQHLI